MKRRHLFSAGLAATAMVLVTGCGKAGPDASTTTAATTAATTGSALSPREAYELAATGHGLSVGPVMAAHVVYVFFDTTCPHCAQLWVDAHPLLGKLKMVWMPVGLLRPQSAPQGATILAAPNPAEAMAQNEASVLQRQGGISADPAPGDDALAKVKTNSVLLGKLGAESVPFIVFKNAKTGEYGSHAGSVGTAELAALAGV